MLFIKLMVSQLIKDPFDLIPIIIKVDRYSISYHGNSTIIQQFYNVQSISKAIATLITLALGRFAASGIGINALEIPIHCTPGPLHNHACMSRTKWLILKDYSSYRSLSHNGFAGTR